jgi:hypothetical protein
MAIDKSLYEAPLGMDEEEPEMEIDIAMDTALPTIITLEDGSIEIDFGDDLGAEQEIPFGDNIAEYLDENELNRIANDLMEEVQGDIDSRKEWVENYVKGLDVLGMSYEERTEPWENACGAYSTVLAEAAIRFQAETMSETFPAAGPVKVKILGKETPEKEEAAARVKTDMNYELTENMIEYRPEHERMLFSLGLAGSAFKKVYFDPSLDRQTSVYIPAEDVIVPFGASHIWSAERVTHIMRKTKTELLMLQDKKFYCDCDLGEPTPYTTDIEERKAKEEGVTITQDSRYTFFEIHAHLNIEGVDTFNDLPKPYVVTIDKSSSKVLAIRRNWGEDDTELRARKNYFVHYVYVPGFGFYGLGLINIVGGYARAGTSLIRQLVDAGTLSNLPGGLKSRDLRIKGDDSPIGPGEWKDVDVPSGSIRDNIMPLPYKEPSPTLMALLDNITNEGRRLGAISDMNISDMSANAPVGTTLALLERTLKPMAAVQSRVHFAMKQEFKLLKDIIAEYAAEDYVYEPETGNVRARRSDYTLVEVIPVSDPNSSTMAQRVVQYQAVMQLAKDAPQIYDLPQLHRQMIEVLGVKNADKLVPVTDDITPSDPVSENMAALVGKPMKAFIYQDHDAHMATHVAFMQDPMIMQAIGQNPQAQQIMASLQAHIAEHLAFAYRRQIEDKLGAQLPPVGQQLPEEIEIHLAKLVADAGRQLTQQHQQQAAQRAAQQAAEDPNLQLQRVAEETKRAEVERKKAKDAADIQIRQDEQARKREKDQTDRVLSAAELAEEKRQADMKAAEAGVARQDQKDESGRKMSMELLDKLTNPPKGNK